MARIIRVDGAEYANDGERRVVEALAEELDDKILLIPNMEVVHRDQVDECDVIVVSEDAVFVIETKDLAGSVVIEENVMIVNGKRRGQPYLQTNSKAKRLRGKLNDLIGDFSSKGWVEPLVVLARQPRSFECQPYMEDRVVGVPRAVELLTPPSPLVHPNQRGRLRGMEGALAEQIVGSARPRSGEQMRWGPYIALQMLFEAGEAGLREFQAVHELTGDEVILEVWASPADAGAAERDAWQERTLAQYRLARALGAHPDLIEPVACFLDDDGVSIVIVWPARTEVALEFADPSRLRDEGAAISIAAGVAAALGHIHGRGYLHGAVDLFSAAVRPDGRGALRFGLELAKDPGGRATDLAGLGTVFGHLASTSGSKVLDELARSLSADKPEDRGPDAALVAAALVAPPAPPEVKAPHFADRFEVTRVRGGSETRQILQVFDRVANAEVIAKVYADAAQDDPSVFREHQILAGINHPNVVRSLGAGSSDIGPYVLTEFLRGPSLREVLDSSGPLTPADAVGLILPVVDALSSFHPARTAGLEGLALSSTGDENEGVVHNDINPGNIRVVPGRGPVLFDFALLQDDEPWGAGPPTAYRPEEVPIGLADPDADVYAVGVLLHELITGRPPHGSEDGLRTLEIDLSLPAELRRVIAQACDPIRSRRFPSAIDFADALVATHIGSEAQVGLAVDLVELAAQIDALVGEGRLDEALALCPPGWTRARRRIERRIEQLAAGGADLLESDGVILRHLSERAVGPGTTGTNLVYDEGTANIYGVFLPDGGLLEFISAKAEVDGVLYRWVQGVAGFNLPRRMIKLTRSLRMNVVNLPGSNDSAFIELSQARIDPNSPEEWSTTKQATVAELSKGAGIEVVEALTAFGASAVAPRHALLGDTSRRRNYVAASMAAANPGHVPAVAYFISRVLPLWRGVTAD